MKGSTKFWLIISIPLLIFFNYKALVFMVIATEEHKLPFFPGAFYLTLIFTELVVIIIGTIRIILIDPGLFFKFNDWLDEKF